MEVLSNNCNHLLKWKSIACMRSIGDCYNACSLAKWYVRKICISFCSVDSSEWRARKTDIARIFVWNALNAYFHGAHGPIPINGWISFWFSLANSRLTSKFCCCCSIYIWSPSLLMKAIDFHLICNGMSTVRYCCISILLHGMHVLIQFPSYITQNWVVVWNCELHTVYAGIAPHKTHLWNVYRRRQQFLLFSVITPLNSTRLDNNRLQVFSRRN